MPDDSTKPNPQVVAQPVHDHPGDPDHPSPGIALCLSGGGYRAMLFHLGTLWRLNELQYLPKLNRVSSVSGGSITSGVLAKSWKSLQFNAEGCATNFDQLVTQPISRMASTSIDVSSVVSGIFGGVSHQVAKHYRDILFGSTTLQDLPDDTQGPRFVFNATSLQTGVLWRFSRPFMGDWIVGLIMNPTVDLATAVAASSAFPPILSPAILEPDPSSFTKGQDPPPPGVTYPDFRKKIVLSDGGVYDNLGLETAWKNYTTILVSDGGAALAMQVDPPHEWLGQAYRVLDVIDNQVGALRKRVLIGSYINKLREGTYWGITTDIANYKLATALACDHSFTLKLAATPTRLTAMEVQLQHQLIDWGYAVCDAAMRTHVVPAAPVPTQSPFGTFRQGQALAAARH
jgi:NTE family protein